MDDLVDWDEEVGGIGCDHGFEEGYACWTEVYGKMGRGVFWVGPEDKMADILEEVLYIADRSVETVTQTWTVWSEVFAFHVSCKSHHVDSCLDECEEDVELSRNDGFPPKGAQKVGVCRCRGEGGRKEVEEEFRWTIIWVLGRYLQCISRDGGGVGLQDCET